MEKITKEWIIIGNYDGSILAEMAKDIFYLKQNKSITKHCDRHSELEDIKKKKSYHNQEQKTVYKVTKHKKNGPLEKPA